jgi:DNA recombination protein RmuC
LSSGDANDVDSTIPPPERRIEQGGAAEVSMVMEFGAVTAIVLGFLSIALTLIVLRRLRSLSPHDSFAQLADRLDSVARNLDEKLTQTRTDLAGRLQQAQGDLSLATADRLSTGFLGLKTGLEHQLSAGRQEQANSLKLEITALTAQTKQSLEAIRSDVDQKLIAITNTVQVKLDQNIKDGFAQFEKVQQHLNEAQEQLKNLGVIGASINDLNNLLKMPHLRGRFGEQGLERLLEDFLPRHMYDLQASPDGEGPGRADAVIKFPDRTLPIDAKFPREQVLALFETNDPQALDEARIEFARVMKEQAKRIAGYIRPESGTTDMALMYLPSETLYMEAVLNAELSDWLNQRRVYPVSPNTLIVTLQSIQMVFKMYEYAKGHERATEELKKAQNAFSHFENRFDDLGKSLLKAQQAFEIAKGHLNRYRNRVTGLTGEPVPELDFPSPPDKVREIA